MNVAHASAKPVNVKVIPMEYFRKNKFFFFFKPDVKESDSE